MKADTAGQGFTSPNDDDSTHVHRQFIGYSGMVLPIALWLLAGRRPTEGLQPWKLLESVSAYYYTGAIAAFVGILAVLGVFLFTYRGYRNKDQNLDRAAAIVAASAAFVVAFFPTCAPTERLRLAWWNPATGTIHYVAAVILFSSFSFFSLFLFPKSNIKGKPLPADKQARNSLYVLCGIGILVCMLWAGSSYFTGAPIFWAEALALECFGASWLVKGRFDSTAVALGKRTLHYGLHPGQLVGDVRNAIRR